MFCSLRHPRSPCTNSDGFDMRLHYTDMTRRCMASSSRFYAACQDAHLSLDSPPTPLWLRSALCLQAQIGQGCTGRVDTYPHHLTWVESWPSRHRRHSICNPHITHNSVPRSPEMICNWMQGFLHDDTWMKPLARSHTEAQKQKRNLARNGRL